MVNVFKQLGNFVGKAFNATTAGAVRDVAGTFLAPRDQRQMNEQEYKLAVLAQFEAYTRAPKEGWFARLVGGLNALPRPLLALGTIALVGYSVVDPLRAKAAYIALVDIPQELWGMLAIVVSFYMGGRLQVKSLNAKAQAQRLENMEKTSNLVMDMIDRLDAREASQTTPSDEAGG